MPQELPAKRRIESIDQLRGIIMIIMALDHVRDFFHDTAMTSDPTNPDTTTPILFFTRWITHFCAPLFVFLAGTSAFLSGQRRTKKQLSVFLATRGLWLVVLEVIVFNFIFSFDPLLRFVGLEVIWVTGISMLLLSVLIYLPLPVLFAIGLLLVGGHNFLDRFNESPAAPDRSMLWALLHQPYFVSFGEGRTFGVLYPLIPWPGIMLLGYCLGSLYTRDYDAAKRRRWLVKAGIVTVLFFLVLRWLNVYGDLVPWKEQKNQVATVLSFFNLTKYPPSLLYCCMTIGPGLLMLAWLEKTKARWPGVAVIYGRVPLYYFLLHFFVIHFLCMIVFFATGHTMDQAAGPMLFRPADFGYPLWVVYLVWMGVVALMYPLCRWYGRYKATHNYWWLPYL